MRFEFATAARIVFGPGTLERLGDLAATMVPETFERRALVVTGSQIVRAQPAIDQLVEQGFECETFAIPQEPTVTLMAMGRELAWKRNSQLIVGFGGGSAIDSAKAIAALVPNGGDPLDYLEVVGRGEPLVHPPLPCIAIPTTAGTGAEVTRNAVLSVPEHRVKVSLRHPLMLPQLALVDPELTYDLPPNVTATTGLDALTQLIEAFISGKANPMSDAFCREGLPRAGRSLRRVYDQGDQPEAREEMALASLFGGLALANGGLGAVHGFAGPLGGMFHAPHGAVCAALIPHVMRINYQALQAAGTSARNQLERFQEIARLLTGRSDAQAENGLLWIQALVDHLKIPPLSDYGLTEADLEILVEKSAAASSMKCNPVRLDQQRMHEILQAAM